MITKELVAQYRVWKRLCEKRKKITDQAAEIAVEETKSWSELKRMLCAEETTLEKVMENVASNVRSRR